MQNYFQREAVNSAKKLIRAFYVLKDVEGSLKFFSRERLTYIGIGENDIFYSFEEVRDYFYKYADVVTSTYKLINENYRVEADSYDSCIVVAKIDFQADEAHLNYRVSLNVSFYFQLIDDKLWITLVHVHMPEKTPEEKLPKETLHANIKFRKDLLRQFENTNYIAAKSFHCKGDLPYRYVNDLFLKLLGCDELNLENYSSLAHIHPNDQQKYFNFMKKIFAEKNAGVSEGWCRHNSYRVIYRLVNCKREEIKVLEWGNLLSLNGNFLVNSFVTPLNEIEVLNATPPQCISKFPRRLA